MAGLLRSGLTLHASLSLQSEQAEKKDAIVLERLISGVEQGIPLSVLLAQNRFHPMAVALVTVGETSGNLTFAFGRLGEYFRHRQEWKQKLMGSLIYPLIVAVVMLLVSLFVLYGILPRFETMYLNLGFDLPSDTKTVFVFASQIRQSLPWLLLSFLLVFFVFIGMRRMLHSRVPSMAEFALSLPGVKTIWRLWISFRFADVTAVLLAGGVPLLNALETSERIALFAIENTILASIRERILVGNTLTEALASQAWFEPMLVHAVHAAEASGDLTNVLGFVAKELEHDLQQLVQRLVQLVEPLLILGLGTGIGLIILAVVMPMMEMVQVI